MADLCVCGHEKREHGRPPTFSRPVPDCADALHGDCWHDDCPCLTYRRSPLSAFRGPAVAMSRDEAAGWLDGLFMASVAAAIRRGESPKAWARQLVQLASYDRRHGIYPRRVALDYLAARILRAVRP